MPGAVMKALVRWSATLGLVGGALFGPSFTGNLAALALTEEQIMQKLQLIPVYAIATPEGNQVRLLPLPYEATPRTGQNAANQADKKVVPGFRFFVSRNEANAFLNELKKSPDLPKTAQVVPMPLSEAYGRAVENKKQPADKQLIIELEPADQQVQAATTLLSQSGQKVNNFNGVPLFAVRFGPDKGYVPILVPDEKNTQKQQEIVPIFFSKEDAQNLLQQVKQKEPKADIQVLNIDGVIETLRSKNDSWLNQVYLIPTPESREVLRSLAPGQGGNRPAQNRPANNAQPAAPKK
jgi:hypothetical protein